MDGQRQEGLQPNDLAANSSNGLPHLQRGQLVGRDLAMQISCEELGVLPVDAEDLDRVRTSGAQRSGQGPP